MLEFPRSSFSPTVDIICCRRRDIGGGQGEGMRINETIEFFETFVRQDTSCGWFFLFCSPHTIRFKNNVLCVLWKSNTQTIFRNFKRLEFRQIHILLYIYNFRFCF